MRLNLLPVILSLSLTACGGSRVKGDLPANDLLVLQQNVHRQTIPTLLPNGKTYCVEDSKTEGSKDDCSLDLEDAVFVGNQKLQRVLDLVDKAVKRMGLQRAPCSAFKKIFSRKEKCDVD